MSVTQSISFSLLVTHQEKLKILKNQVRAFGPRQVRTTILISKKEVDEKRMSSGFFLNLTDLLITCTFLN